MKREHLALLVMVLTALLLYRIFLAIKWAPTTPDLWSTDEDEAVQQPEAVPLCPHCLSLQEEEREFCAACGSATGLYNNLNPYLYIFSLGEVLRLGTYGRIKKNPVTVAGYLLLSVAEYNVFAPLYWYFFFRNLRNCKRKLHRLAARKRHTLMRATPLTAATRRSVAVKDIVGGGLRNLSLLPIKPNGATLLGPLNHGSQSPGWLRQMRISLKRLR